MRATSLGIALFVAAALPVFAVENSPVDCQQRYHTEYRDGSQTYYAQETQTIAANAAPVLSVRPSRNGGVTVEGWDQPQIQVTACKTADEQALLSQMRMVINGGEVTSEGPDTGNWTMHFVVRVPGGIHVQAEAHNGPISVTKVSGTVQVTSRNGPISIKQSTGNITANAENGPISLSETSGKIKATAQNGPVTVRLNNSEWRGEGLEASTRNGPITLRVPANYRSGVEVVSDGRSPFSCGVCKPENRTWDASGAKSVHLGDANAPVLVRLSSVNGPVSIRDTYE